MRAARNGDPAVLVMSATENSEKIVVLIGFRFGSAATVAMLDVGSGPPWR